MEDKKVLNKAVAGGVTAPALPPPINKTRKLSRFEVLIEYPGHKQGEIIEHNEKAFAVRQNVANGIWKKL